jgi:tetratricopeptide (TPR) repeat protein
MHPLQRGLLPALLLLSACAGGEDPTPPGSAAGSQATSPEASAALARGMSLAQGGASEEAAEAYREAIRLDPELAQAHFALGRALIGLSSVSAGRGGEAPGVEGSVVLGRDDAVVAEGVASLARAVELAPDDLEIRYWHGRALHVAGRKAKAIAVLEEVVARDPEHGAAHKRLGLIHLDDGDAQRASEHFGVAEELLPRDPGVPFQHANVLLEDDPEGARAAYERALAIDPTFAPAHNGLAGVLYRLGDVDGAQAAKEAFETWRTFEDRVPFVERRAERKPGNLDAQITAGEVFLVKHDWERAQYFLDRALMVDPKSSVAHLLSGMAAHELGEAERARDHLEEALFLAPESFEARIELIRVCVAAGDGARLDEIVAELEAAAGSLAPQDLLELAGVLLEAGRREEAASHFEAVLAQYPDNQVAREGLGRARGESEE